MKISKSIFKTEIEFTTDELRELRGKVPLSVAVGLLFWLKKTFGLNMLPQLKKEQNEL